MPGEFAFAAFGEYVAYVLKLESFCAASGLTPEAVSHGLGLPIIFTAADFAAVHDFQAVAAGAG